METGSQKETNSDGEDKVKGWGLIVYGGMMMLGGGMLAMNRPGFIVVAAIGSIAFVIGLVALSRRFRQHLRVDKK
jgi:uncharacterized membrane protein HdeD (DUF308 family)